MFKICASQGVTNFVLYKFGHLSQKEWQTMYDLAKMFLHCLNHWKLETPTTRKNHAQTDDVSVYKVNYTRYEPVKCGKKSWSEAILTHHR